jgi:hypothetical protein
MNAYWTCQLIGWGLTSVVTGGIPTLYGGMSWVVAGRAIAGGVLGLAFTHRLRSHMRVSRWLELPLRRLVPRIAAASLGIAGAMVLLLMPFFLRILPGPDRAGPLSAILATHAALLFAWSALYTGYHYLRGVRSAEAERWRLAVAMRDTELLALRTQLNPHFLFNSLNSLRALVSEDPARAQEAITGLAGLLRYTLQLSRSRTTTLGRELEATRHYLELEALRLESRLQYRIDADPRTLEHPVPPMLVQTLVENAVKHGIAPSPEGGAVTVEVFKPAEDLTIRVTNPGTLNGNAESGGIGLSNSLERLRLLFGERVRFDLWESAPDQVRCEIVIPSQAKPMRTDEPAPAKYS